MKTGVFAKTFPGTDPTAVLGACRAAGFQSVQYNMACSGSGPLPEAISADAANAVAAAAQATGIEIAAISATYNMTDPDPVRRAAGRRAFAAIAGRAGAMGTKLVTVCSGSLDPGDQWRRHPDNHTPAAWHDMCREFAHLLELAEAHDILIGVEPEHANVVSSAPKARLLLDTFAGSRIRIVLDPANLLEGIAASRQRRLLDEAFDLLGPDLALAHVKDRDAGGLVVAAPMGIVDWPHYLGALMAQGFDGHLIAHGMNADAAPSVAEFLKRTLAAL